MDRPHVRADVGIGPYGIARSIPAECGGARRSRPTVFYRKNFVGRGLCAPPEHKNRALKISYISVGAASPTPLAHRTHRHASKSSSGFVRSS